MTRCFLVSNRLPLAFDNKQHNFVPAAGGLASAIKGLDPLKVGFDFEWMGVLTDEIEEEKINDLRETPFGDIKCHPIIVKKETYHHYYNGYCNDVIWPLFHYESARVQNTQAGWAAYCEVNLRVAEAVLSKVQDDDTVWVHDFQLMLVPGLLKQKKPNLKVGFFLHIPFPSSEIFRELPQRKEILQSLVRCDLIGFHDLSYLNHFKSSVQRILGINPNQLGESMGGVYPISIDTPHFLGLAKAPATIEFIQKYKHNKGDLKWILGVDRLDYSKGLVMKLQAFKEFLEDFQEERGQVQLVQIVIPSRTEVPEYQNLKKEIEQLVSNINGQFGTPVYMPVTYIYQSVSENELSALYQLSDAILIGSTRDGMNLVSLEYVVSQTDDYPGVLLLSEFTGAHSTLSYAMSINPRNVKDTAARIKDALHHPLVKRRGEIGAMKKFLQSYTSSDWAKIFLRDLHHEVATPEKTIPMPQDGKFTWLPELKGKKVTFFCDLDGTLAPISPHPQDVRLHSETVELLKQISDTGVEFVVVSGRDKEFLEEQFIHNDFAFPLAACHGAYSYSPESHEWSNLVAHDSIRWKDSVIDILNLYSKRTPGSFIEDKGHALTWHYRNSPPEFADFLANKLFLELESTLTSQPVQVNRGKKVIEVKSIHANKGFFVQQWLLTRHSKPDVVVALGDDTTDEDMFNVLQGQRDFNPFCIKVGKESTGAKYFIRDQNSVNLFLRRFLSSIDQTV